MNPFDRYPQSGHKVRPWWRKAVTVCVGLVSENFYYLRSDGRKSPKEYYWHRQMTEERQADLDAEILADLEKLDREDPMPMPPILVNQVWGWQGNAWCEATVTRLYLEDGVVTHAHLDGPNTSFMRDDHKEKTVEDYFSNKVLLYGPRAPWAPGDWQS